MNFNLAKHLRKTRSTELKLPRIRIRIKMKRIHNTEQKTWMNLSKQIIKAEIIKN